MWTITKRFGRFFLRHSVEF